MRESRSLEELWAILLLQHPGVNVVATWARFSFSAWRMSNCTWGLTPFENLLERPCLIFALSFRSENLLGFRRSVILYRGCLLSCLRVFFGCSGMFGLVRVCGCHLTRNFHEVPTFQIPRFEFGVVLSQLPPVALFSCIPFGDAGHGFSG